MTADNLSCVALKYNTLPQTSLHCWLEVFGDVLSQTASAQAQLRNISQSNDVCESLVFSFVK